MTVVHMCNILHTLHTHMDMYCGMCTLIKLIVERCTCISSTCNDDGVGRLRMLLKILDALLLHMHTVSTVA